MPLGLFGAVQNYPQMLRKIAGFSFLFSVLAICLLRSQIPSISTFLNNYTYEVPVFKVPLPPGVFLPAFAFVFISRIIKLHDRLSDLFKLRVNFDTKHILLPMARGSEAKNTKINAPTLMENRHELMNKVFYKFASSTPGQASIDTHYITMALDQWSWFWIVQEAISISFITALILLVAGRIIPSLILAGLMALGILFLVYIWRGCRKYATAEIDQILDNPGRKREIAEVFNAL